MSEENKQINTGGPAFPLNWEKQGEFWAFGITARDYFAAKAMQAFIGNEDGPSGVVDIAEGSYVIADAMLKAREPK